jgi:bifunctional UDP-N-acetylglucosamine pyrophosphorylase/glucosamine-1-phosphate N-acetyltransferase
MQNISILILAAGRGKRMQDKEAPKALTLLDGKPLIRYVLDAVGDSGVGEQPVIVVGWQADKVKAELGSDFEYALQIEQLGTGHAVRAARSVLERRAEHLIVLNADTPFISSSRIAEMARVHLESDASLTMATCTVEDFAGARASFSSFGRVVRDRDGQVFRIVEMKDANEEERSLKECNPGYYCFKADWLWLNLEMLKNDNAQSEYYLTDLVRAAVANGDRIASIAADPYEAIGINTADDLEFARRVMKERRGVEVMGAEPEKVA